MSVLTAKSVPELEIDDGELRILRQRLSREKQALQGQLAELNAKCTERLPSKEFHRIQSVRGGLVKQLGEKEAELGEINAQRAELLTVLQIRKASSVNIRKLVEVRDRWHGFSMDSANHQKAREVAWKISQELRDVLKTYFEAGSQGS